MAQKVLAVHADKGAQSVSPSGDLTPWAPSPQKFWAENYQNVNYGPPKF